MTALKQLDLFGPVLGAYLSADAPVSNDALYARISAKTGLMPSVWNEKAPIGKAGEMHSPARRRVRWMQQALKQMGLIERTGLARGEWRITASAKASLTPAKPKHVQIAFSTKLGLALWGSNMDVFPRLDEPIHLVLTSPPYCLRNPRAYGNVDQTEYVDFVCESLEPLVKNLVRGGSIVLNISNDIFEPKSPARSIYRERLVIALHDRLGLKKMDELIWFNNSKAPGPLQWASRTRQQLNTGYEPVYWFTNDPEACLANNRRVLRPHSARHQKLIDRGGETRRAQYADGANRMLPGAFGNATPGSIPKNVLEYGHRCFSQVAVREYASQQGMPVHGAAMPLKLARFLVDFLTEKDQMVVDHFAGYFTTPAAAEDAGCRWIATELMGEYAHAGAQRFKDRPGFKLFLH